MTDTMTDTFNPLPMNQLSSIQDEDSTFSSTSSSLLLPPSSFQKRASKTKKPYVSPSMQGYQQKMKLAQASKGIAYGSGQTVGRMPLQQLLSGQQGDLTMIPTKFQVPIFQRRYCWTETQWQTLLMDAATTKGDHLHSLGRLTCTNSLLPREKEEKVALEDQRSVILDGQQRFTTLTLLLAAIRDTLHKRLQRSLQNKLRLDQELAAQKIAELDQILFPDQEDYQQFLQNSPTLQEGTELSFAKLIPTYCDRWSYYSAILPSHVAIQGRLEFTQTAFHRPLAAKQYYNGMLSTFSNGEVFHLLDGVYTKLTMLLFPIEIGGSSNSQEYGTDDLMVVYERLAIRDATWCTPTRSHEYVRMSGLDMIRNALLGTFLSQQEALEFYQAYWLPMERMAAASVVTVVDDPAANNGDHQQQQQEGNLQSMMSAFFDEQNLQEEEEKLEEGTVGGLLYVRFQLWQDKQQFNNTDDSSMSAEQATRQQGETMLAFAKDYFQSS